MSRALHPPSVVVPSVLHRPAPELDGWMDGSSASTFGERLRRFREAAGLSQEALAERSGLSARGISDLERGLRRLPRLETVRLLADALPLDPDDRAAFLAAARTASLGLAATNRLRSSPSALPIAPTTLIGRDEEIAGLRERMSQPTARLVTLLGPGGVGKTRLALA